MAVVAAAEDTAPSVDVETMRIRGEFLFSSVSSQNSLIIFLGGGCGGTVLRIRIYLLTVAHKTCRAQPSQE
jgi:hypothetical protein